MVYNISMSSGLSKEEIDYLLNLEKNCKSSQKYNFPSLGGKIEIELSSADKNEDFLLDVWRSHIDLAKTKFQNRARKTVPIVRLDINSAPHKILMECTWAERIFIFIEKVMVINLRILYQTSLRIVKVLEIFLKSLWIIAIL